MGTVILLNLANFAHWIAFPAIAKKAAAYYDVSGFAEWELGIDMICITLPSGEELDLIPTVSYAAGVPTCLIATYLIESRGLKTGVSNYLRSSCNQSHWGATYLQVLRLCDNVLLGEDWSLPDWVWGSPMLSFYIPRHQFNGKFFVWADTLISCIFALQVPKYQQYWMAVVGQVGQEYSSRCQPSASCTFCITMLLVISSHCNHISYCYWSLGTDRARLSLHLRSANENLPTLARPCHDQSSSSSLSSYLTATSSSSSWSVSSSSQSSSASSPASLSSFTWLPRNVFLQLSSFTQRICPMHR